MARPVTIFSGQWADLPFETLCQKMKSFGYDGIELACWGDHFDVFQAAKSKAYCDDKKAVLAAHGLQESDLDEVVRQASAASSMKGNPVPLGPEVLAAILRRAL